MSLVVIRCHSLYHFLSFVFTRCHSLSFVVPLVVTRSPSLPFVVPLVVTPCTTRCHSLSIVVIRCHCLHHSLSLVVTRCTTRLFFYKRSFHLKLIDIINNKDLLCIYLVLFHSEFLQLVHLFEKTKVQSVRGMLFVTIVVDLPCE